MTMPAFNSFQLYQGDTLRFTMTLKSGLDPYEIPTSASFSGAVKEKKSKDITTSFQSEVISSASGQVLFVLPTEASSLLDAKKNWIYDIQIKTDDNTVRTLLAGNIFVTDQVTP